MIFSKVAASTSQPVAFFNRHLSTCGHLTVLRNKPQKKQPSQLLAVVLWCLVRLLMELLIGDETCTLPLCAYVVVGFDKAHHIAILDFTLQFI